MKSMFSGVLLATTALSATPAMASEVSVLDTMGPILATAPDGATIDAKCDAYVAAITERKTALESESGPATVDGTLTRYDELNALLGAGSGEFTLYQEVMADQERRDAGAACQVRLATLGSSIGLSRPIYDRLKAIDVGGADAATQWYLSRTLQAFEASGVALPDGPRARVQELNEKLAELGTTFQNNIANGRGVIKVRPEELAGLPADFIAARKPGADGLIEISTDTPDYQPVMTYAESDDLRRRLSEVYNRRAYPANDEVLTQIFTLRQELATILGRPNYAALVLEDKMVNTPEKVQTLLTDMAAAARPAAMADYAKNLEVLRELRPGAEKIEFWQTGWLSPKVQQKFYAYDPQEARQYFAYDNVRDGILRLTEDLFGVEIREWDTPVWDPEVETYEMVENGNVIGRFYFDNHPRPGKYSHANMVPVRPGLNGEPPVAALVQNLPDGDHSTGLMEHSQVTTFLHEFGHMIHGMFGGHTRWLGQSGVATEWDFVEAPSQMLENWVYDFDTLAKFAVDKDGNTIPRDLVERMNHARYFNLGLGDMTQLGYANISLQFHQNPVPDNLGAATRQWRDQYAIVPSPEWVEMQDAFGHLNGYSAIYYTYRWSKVIADDLFTRFKADGLRNATTAAEYRAKVLAKGGTEPAAELVRDFLGRDISLEAYKAELAKGQ
ncbi:peptidase M3 [Altererythrobacter salegens]|uniref:Peptidase M3 n=1 Tax=Croceibacterium salegens TaxID=1737568 RepID=A0A6I4SS86_9SPHN|nr:M3 family metallopeptidase [Croceibacterium salegens]MXO58841.1 peptidase M3 [Croceibacterium salegens]